MSRALKATYSSALLCCTAAVSLMVMPGCGNAPEATVAAPTERTFVVETKITGTSDIRVTVDAVGSIQASEEAEIRPQVDGIIAEIAFTEGGEVAEGDLLVRIDDRKAQARLALAEASRDSAKARLELARRRLARQRKLRSEKLISEEEFDAIEAEYFEADANARESAAAVTLAQRELEDFHIKAPFSGRVGERRIDVGNYVEDGTVLVVLMRNDPIDVAFKVPDRYAANLGPGTSVEISLGGSADTVKGTVSFVDPRVDVSTRMLSVRATVANSDERLRHGQFASVAVVVAERLGQVVIPEEAVLSQAGKTWVFIVADGKAVQRDLQLGERRPPLVEVLSGVSQGETVIVGGQHRLRDGSAVRSADANAGA